MTPRSKHVIDVHFHYGWGVESEELSDPDSHVEWILRSYPIDRIVGCCITPGGEFPTPADIRAANDKGLTAMRNFAGVYYSLCYLNATHGEAACLAELERCLDAGMVGVKLWISQLADDPSVYPIAQRCGDLGLPMLIHALVKSRGQMLRESKPEHIARVSNRFPETPIYMAHYGGPPEFGSRGLAEAPNLYVDVGGSSAEYGSTEKLLRACGPERLLFGTDNMSYPFCLAKIAGAGIEGEHFEMAMWKNANRLFRFFTDEP